MRVSRLKLANVRAIEAAELHFRPGFNLIVGVNGVGKSTILEALAMCLADVVRKMNPGGRSIGAKRFGAKDIRIGGAGLDVECDCLSGEEPYCSVVIHEEPDRDQGSRECRPAKSPATVDEDGEFPIAVLFSAARAVPSRPTSRRSSAAKGSKAAFQRALESRELRLDEFAGWMEARRALGRERPGATRVLKGLQSALTHFLPDYKRLRLGGWETEHLLINRGAATLPVRLLSEGERGLLALVLDLTRRLSLANAGFAEPAVESEAVVLIDEIELHLHPKWQRQIVRNLTTAFPRCQFIATTHSPQVIGEVEPDRIHIMADGEVYSPTHSFGVDSSRVLEEVMDAPSRTESVRCLLSEISRRIGKNRFDEARPLVTRLVGILGENDPEVTRVRVLLDFMEGGE